MLDLRQLGSFISLGREDFSELLEDMRNDVPKYLALIHSAMQAGDGEGSSAAAHSCRGMLSYFGCVALNVRLTTIEKFDSVSPSQATPIFDELTELWAESLAAIKEWERGVPEFN